MDDKEEALYKDMGRNVWVNTKELNKLKNIIENQEKRIVWCEENIKVNNYAVSKGPDV